MLGVLASDEVDVIAIGRKGEAAVARGRGRYHLCVASRGNVTEPERLQAVFLKDMEQVFSVGRNSSEEDMAVVGEIFDRHGFDGQGFFAGQEGIDAKGRGNEQQECDYQRDSGAELVFGCGGDEDGTEIGRASCRERV